MINTIQKYIHLVFRVMFHFYIKEYGKDYIEIEDENDRKELVKSNIDDIYSRTKMAILTPVYLVLMIFNVILISDFLKFNIPSLFSFNISVLTIVISFFQIKKFKTFVIPIDSMIELMNYKIEKSPLQKFIIGISYLLLTIGILIVIIETNEYITTGKFRF